MAKERETFLGPQFMIYIMQLNDKSKTVMLQPAKSERRIIHTQIYKSHSPFDLHSQFIVSEKQMHKL